MTTIKVPPVGFISEPASSFFSFLTALTGVYFLRLYYRWSRYQKAKYRRVYPYSTMWMVYLGIVIVTFLASTIFHIRDVYWTERFDYFLAMMTLCALLFNTIVSVFEISNKIILWAVICPFVSFYLYYLHYMLVDTFDYGWHVNVGITLIMASVVLWFLWACVRARSHRSTIFPFILGIFVFGGLEVFEFDPIFIHFDAHSLWHASNPYFVWAMFLLLSRETKYHFDLCDEKDDDHGHED